MTNSTPTMKRMIRLWAKGKSQRNIKENGVKEKKKEREGLSHAPDALRSFKSSELSILINSITSLKPRSGQALQSFPLIVSVTAKIKSYPITSYDVDFHMTLIRKALSDTSGYPDLPQMDSYR